MITFEEYSKTPHPRFIVPIDQIKSIATAAPYNYEWVYEGTDDISDYPGGVSITNRSKFFQPHIHLAQRQVAPHTPINMNTLMSVNRPKAYMSVDIYNSQTVALDIPACLWFNDAWSRRMNDALTDRDDDFKKITDFSDPSNFIFYRSYMTIPFSDISATIGRSQNRETTAGRTIMAYWDIFNFHQSLKGTSVECGLATFKYAMRYLVDYNHYFGANALSKIYFEIKKRELGEDAFTPEERVTSAILEM